MQMFMQQNTDQTSLPGNKNILELDQEGSGLYMPSPVEGSLFPEYSFVSFSFRLELMELF